MVLVVVVCGPLAPIPSWRGQSGIRACPRRLAWRHRAPRPSFAEFCSRPPTWARGQAPRQGPVLVNNASVFLLPVEGRSAEDEVGQTGSKGRREGCREGLSPRGTPGAGSFPEALGRWGVGMTGSLAGRGWGEDLGQGPPGPGSASLQWQQERVGWDKRRDLLKLKNALHKFIEWGFVIGRTPEFPGPLPPREGRGLQWQCGTVPPPSTLSLSTASWVSLPAQGSRTSAKRGFGCDMD